MKSKCNLIIDSCCDLPYDLVDVEGVTLLHFPYLMKGSQKYDDLFTSTSANEFYDAIRDGVEPSTAQVPLMEMERVWREAAQSGVPTVCLAFTSGLSGNFDTMTLIFEKTKEEFPEAELYLVDTLNASIAEGLLVFEALRQREQGLSAAELAAWAEEAKYYVHAVFMVDDLQSLRRGGRIPAAIARAGMMLDVKALLTFDLDGTLAPFGVARGRKKGMKQMVDYFVESVDRTSNVHQAILGHADCPKEFARFRDMLIKADPDAIALDCNIGPVIGSHVGPDMLAVVFWGDDRRATLSLTDRIAQKVRGR